MLRSYPNPNRQAAPVWMPLRKPRARITADMGDNMEGNAHFDHIMHCSPCYAEFLAERKRLSLPWP
jgi:hypothetical protein